MEDMLQEFSSAKGGHLKKTHIMLVIVTLRMRGLQPFFKKIHMPTFPIPANSQPIPNNFHISRPPWGNTSFPSMGENTICGKKHYWRNHIKLP
jgi:hypothetical protein